MKNTTPFNFKDQAKKSKEESLEELNNQDLKITPRKQIVNNILNYSKAFSIRKSSEIGFIENLLN